MALFSSTSTPEPYACTLRLTLLIMFCTTSGCSFFSTEIHFFHVFLIFVLLGKIAQCFLTGPNSGAREGMGRGSLHVLEYECEPVGFAPLHDNIWKVAQGWIWLEDRRDLVLFQQRKQTLLWTLPEIDLPVYSPGSPGHHCAERWWTVTSEVLDVSVIIHDEIMSLRVYSFRVRHFYNFPFVPFVSIWNLLDFVRKQSLPVLACLTDSTFWTQPWPNHWDSV